MIELGDKDVDTMFFAEEIKLFLRHCYDYMIYKPGTRELQYVDAQTSSDFFFLQYIRKDPEWLREQLSPLVDQFLTRDTHTNTTRIKVDIVDRWKALVLNRRTLGEKYGERWMQWSRTRKERVQINAVVEKALRLICVTLPSD